MRTRVLHPLSFLLLLAVGCGSSDRVHVSGRVTRTDGTPVNGAKVLLRSQETGKSARGVTDSEGRYELGVETKGDGIAPGEYGVAVAEDRGSWDSPKPRTVHARYESPSTSELTLTVEPSGSITFDLTLDPPAGGS